MYRILLYFFSFFLIYPVYSQTIFFHEDFELPSGADSVSSWGNPGWNINTSLAYMSNQSMHSGVAVSDTSILTTKSFSTLGQSAVYLSFSHIAKIEWNDIATIEVSIDSVNWSHVTTYNAVYMGTGFFNAPTAFRFSSLSYNAWDPGNNNSIPDSTWWRNELFDLSSLLANMPSAWIRFKLRDGWTNGSSGNYGWLIDNIIVSDTPPIFSLSGLIFYDLNSNGVQEPGEIQISMQKINVAPLGVTLYPWSGNFLFFVLPGNYQLSIIPDSGWHLTTAPVVHNVGVTNLNIGNLNFGVAPDSAYYSINGGPKTGYSRCFDRIDYLLFYTNNGTLPSDSVRIIFDADPNLSFNSSFPPPDLIAGNTFTWTRAGLMPFQSGGMHLQMNLPVPAGTVITSMMTVNHLDNTGNIVATDLDTVVKIVTCAWDPNDKSVDPPGVQAQNFTLMGEELEYMIRFQNTGNDTAFKVVIVDTLSMHLDLETFKLISMSHDLSSAVINNGTITFTFDDIYLPDSIVDEPNSHGFIVFSINHKPNLTDQTKIENTAYIYFDFNAAVVTNTTLNTMVNQIPVSIPGIKNEEIIRLYPNPVNHFFNLAGVKENAQYNIADLSGRIIKTGKITSENDLINVEGIKAGAYILRLHSKELIYTIKFFKIE